MTFDDKWFKDVARRTKQLESRRNPKKFHVTHIDDIGDAQELGQFDSYKDAFISVHKHIKDHTLKDGLKGIPHDYVISDGPMKGTERYDQEWADNDISHHSNAVSDHFASAEHRDTYEKEIEHIRKDLYK